MLRAVVAPICLVVLPIALTACGNDPRTEVPVTTNSPSGQSTAPSAQAAEERDHALVRVVHAIPGGPSVDVFADDNRVFQNLAYKAVTPYQEVDGQRYAFHVRPTGAAVSTDALGSNREGLDDGDYYTVFALPGDRAGAYLRVVEDDHSTPMQGKARVRVVHAAAGAEEVDVFATGRSDELFDGVDFQSVTDYDEIDPVFGALQVRPEGSEAVLLTVPEVRLDAGKSYTVVVVGAAAGRGAQKLEAFVIEDQPAAPVARR